MSSVVSHNDKKLIDDALVFAKVQEQWVEKCKKDFGEKEIFGLWMDAKGIFSSSDKEAVLRKMSKYGKIYEGVLSCMELVSKCDERSYQKLLELYRTLEEFEKDAECDVSESSKALCIVARNFLDCHCKLDHKLKRVECVVLVQEISKMKALADNLSNKLDNTIRNIDKLHEDDRNLKKLIGDIREENQDLKSTMRKIRRENQELKDSISESNARADQRLQEMMEENRRNMERMLRECRSGSNSTEDESNSPEDGSNSTKDGSNSTEDGSNST